MNIAQLTESVASELGLPRSQARLAITAVFGAITEAAIRGEEISLPAFGKFKVVARPSREGRNPATGAAIRIPASRKLAYVAAKQLKDRLRSVAR